MTWKVLERLPCFACFKKVASSEETVGGLPAFSRAID
jgi:hypothetical protein